MEYGTKQYQSPYTPISPMMPGCAPCSPPRPHHSGHHHGQWPMGSMPMYGNQPNPYMQPSPYMQPEPYQNGYQQSEGFGYAPTEPMMMNPQGQMIPMSRYQQPEQINQYKEQDDYED